MEKRTWTHRGRDEGPLRNVYFGCESYLWGRKSAWPGIFYQEHRRRRQLDNSQSHRHGRYEWHHGYLFQRSIERLCGGHDPHNFSADCSTPYYGRIAKTIDGGET